MDSTGAPYVCVCTLVLLLLSVGYTQCSDDSATQNPDEDKSNFQGKSWSKSYSWSTSFGTPPSETSNFQQFGSNSFGAPYTNQQFGSQSFGTPYTNQQFGRQSFGPPYPYQQFGSQSFMPNQQFNGQSFIPPLPDYSRPSGSQTGSGFGFTGN